MFPSYLKLFIVMIPFVFGIGVDHGLITNLQNQLKVVSDSVKIVEKQCSRDPSERKVVAFHATLNSDIVNLPEKSPLVFDKVKVNVDNGYDPKTGVFACPYGGTYVFDWTILTKKNTHFHSELLVNGVQVAVNNLHASIGIHRQATTMTIVELSKGDKVWIKPHTGYIGYFAYGSEWSKFSGFRL